MDFKGQVDSERTYQVVIVAPSVRLRRTSFPRPPPFAPSPVGAFTPQRTCAPLLQLVGFVHGYLRQSFEITFYYWLAASVLAGVLCVPSWPWLWNRDPVIWADDERITLSTQELAAKKVRSCCRAHRAPLPSRARTRSGPPSTPQPHLPVKQAASKEKKN